MKAARGHYLDLRTSRRTRMVEPEEVGQMLALGRLGWGAKRYLAAGGYVPYRSPARLGKLAGLGTWLQQHFTQHRGNCDVVRQELQRQHGIEVSLRTVERACRGFRAELAAQARATLRFETAPGQQLQIDFGSATVEIGGERQKVHVFVATLGYSRLGYVAAFTHERQSAWLAGLEGAFAHFGGIPREVLLDNAKALVQSHDIQTREVSFNERLLAFARHWGFTPKACAPFRPRTKGKDENGVGYVKKNALAGHAFASWEALAAHLVRWQREVAEVRCHGTTGEAPRLRFERDERSALQPLAGKPPFAQARELQRVVSSEACVEVDTNRYSVPWRLIGESVSVVVEADSVVVRHAGQVVAQHAQLAGQRQWAINPAHFDGLVGAAFRPRPEGGGEVGAAVPAPPPAAPLAPLSGELARPLAEYEAVTGGRF